MQHPYLVLTGPTRAVITCSDPGNIEIMLKVKGEAESGDRDLSILAITLKSDGYCSFHEEEYSSERSTLKLEFHHIGHAVEAIISVRLIGGSSLLPISGFQGIITPLVLSV